MAFVLAHETEFTKGHYGDYDFVRTENDSNDPGGVTRLGVDQRSHPKVNVKNLSLGQALEIYKEDYWQPIYADKMSSALALCVFDAAVNVGKSRSIKWLQAALNLTADGVIGPKTLKALEDSYSSHQALTTKLLNRREYYYRSEVRASLRQHYLKGWLARTSDLRKAIS